MKSKPLRTARSLSASSSLPGTSASEGRNFVSFTSTVRWPFGPLTTGSASSSAISRNGGGLFRFFSMISRGIGMSFIRTPSSASNARQCWRSSISNSHARQYTSRPPACATADATARASRRVNSPSIAST